MAHSIITLTTDFSRADAYVAQMKGVILSINPDATIVDVTHEIPPQSIAVGAIVLGQAWQTFPQGTIHVAVVDPGVGTCRGLLAANYSGHLFVLPNNGLLSYVLKSGASEQIVKLQNQSYWRHPVSSTFHGRDIMAPVAAHLSLGVPVGELGPPATDVELLELPAPRVEGQWLIGEIIAIDGFGNLVTNIERSHFVQLSSSDVVVRCCRQRINSISTTYGEHSAGTVIALWGSHGHLELASVNGSIAALIGAHVSDSVEISW